MVENYKYFEHHGRYAFGGPVGSWTGRLDHLAWGKSSNLMLYFTDLATGERCWLSVYSSGGYAPRKSDYDFRTAAPGTVFQLETAKTKSGNPNLVTAQPLGEAERQHQWRAITAPAP